MILGDQSELEKKIHFVKFELEILFKNVKVYLYSTVLTIILAKSELHDFTQGKNYYGPTFPGTLTHQKKMKICNKKKQQSIGFA